jgi:transcriptional regulator with XRE-family HTH domain
MTSEKTSPFGRGLRHWRHLRGVSQLQLATSAGTTTRYVSFLETGRSRPSKDVVERLCDALMVPLRERNRLLEMAGLPPAYPEGDLSADDLAPFQRVIRQLLDSHEPFPGFVVNGSGTSSRRTAAPRCSCTLPTNVTPCGSSSGHGAR